MAVTHYAIFKGKSFFLNNYFEIPGDLLVYGFFRGVSNIIIVSTSINYTYLQFQLWAKSPWLSNVNYLLLLLIMQINVKMMASSPLKLIA